MKIGRALAFGAAGSAALFVAGWIGFAAVSWLGYSRLGVDRHADRVLDPFMPVYEIAERHETTVTAPADVTFAAATKFSLEQSPVIRAIFRARELILRAPHENGMVRQPLLEETKRLGWGVLSEQPHRFVVMGAVTQPWQARVVFQALPANEFAAFDKPRFVKIAWTLEVEPVSESTSVLRTVTRVKTTDARARSNFRRYWALFSPGIWLIRKESLRIIRSDAERRRR